MWATLLLCSVMLGGYHAWDIPACGPRSTGQFLPNPGNCSQFYICANERPYLKECQDGLFFNAKLKICDWPTNVRCKNTSAGNSTYGTPALEPGSCLAHDEGRFSPDPEDCGRFYICSHQEWVLKSCLNSTHFNPALNVCDWPEAAGCQLGVNVNKTSKIQPNPCEEATLEKYLVPDRKKCEVFYSCPGEKPVLMFCPLGLHFNYEAQICDWPENVMCNSSIEDSRSEPSCSGDDEGNLSPDPEDCGRFYVCSHRQWTLKSCHNDTHFNPLLKICD